VPETIKARYSKGKIEPLEKVDIAEGEELLVTLVKVPSVSKEDRFEKSAGGWKGTIDAEKLIEDIYSSRRAPTRREPKL
jgi:predicted DNA-binding antitoxin AbrB/MazE fold protein